MSPAHLMAIVETLRARDVDELRASVREATLQEWAAKRSLAPGLSWTVMVDGVPMWCGGVLEGVVRGIGTMWLVGAKGCERYVKHAMRIFRIIVKHGGFRRIECKCFADNESANRYALHIGFTLEGCLKAWAADGRDINQYGMVLP